MSNIILCSLGISMIILLISASILILMESKIFNHRVYLLKDKDDVLIAAFGSKSEVMSFFWQLCEKTKEDLKIPMFKSDYFRVAQLYLTSLGYKLVKVKPGDLEYVEHN